MAYTVNDSTDLEMTRYNEAADIKQYSGASAENVRGGYVQHDPIRKVEGVYIDLPSGGKLRVGDRPVQVAQADTMLTQTDATAAPAALVPTAAPKPVSLRPTAMAAAPQTIAEYDAQLRATSDRAPTAADFEGNYTAEEFAQYQQSLQGPEMVPRTMTADQMAEYAKQPGAQMVMPRDTSIAENMQSGIYNTLDPNREQTGGVMDTVSSVLQDLIGKENLTPSMLSQISGDLTMFADFFAPGIGGAMSVDEGTTLIDSGYSMMKNGLAQGDTGMAVSGLIDATLGSVFTGLGVAELVPMVKGLTKPARELLGQASPAMKARVADLIGASRAITQGDREMLMEIFQPAGTPRSLGAAAPTDRPITPEYLQQIGVEVPPSRGGLPGRISTRLPTAAKATEDPMTGELVIGYDELKADPKVFEPNVNIVRDYPNMRPQPDATTDETAEQFITHVKDNLLYLYDQVPEATRARSQLWYDGARAITDRWSKEYGVADTGVAGALAALSPQKDWYQNVSLAQRVLNVVKSKGNNPSVFSPEMEQTFRRFESLNKPKYEPLLDAIKGKSYDEITDPDQAVQNTLRALFVRLHDQTYSLPEYKIVGPEGDFLDVARNADGAASRVAWGSLNEIGKAIGAIEANGVVRTISRLMGERHKVRNFYNNIYDPNSPYGDVTIDTHAVAAGLLRPLSGNSLEVDHNFKNMSVAGRGTTKGSAVSGVSGNYGLYAEAYRRAAAERAILPRQMQSITWEAVRGLFPDTFKTAKNNADVDAIWTRYRNGEIEIDEARSLVSERAGGIRPPSWQQQ